jgi:hypothetical protein
MTPMRVCGTSFAVGADDQSDRARQISRENIDEIAGWADHLARMTEKQTPTGSGRDRQGLRMDGLRLGGRMEDLGVTPRTRAAIQARDLGSGKLK